MLRNMQRGKIKGKGYRTTGVIKGMIKRQIMQYRVCDIVKGVRCVSVMSPEVQRGV